LSWELRSSKSPLHFFIMSTLQLLLFLEQNKKHVYVLQALVCVRPDMEKYLIRNWDRHHDNFSHHKTSDPDVVYIQQYASSDARGEDRQ
jgi:hypothetical protein